MGVYGGVRRNTKLSSDRGVGLSFLVVCCFGAPAWIWCCFLIRGGVFGRDVHQDDTKIHDSNA